MYDAIYVFYQCLWYVDVMYAHVSWFAVLLRKINPWLLLRICGFFMSWSRSVDEFPFREINFVLREMPCTAWKICLGNLEKLDDFYRGLITGSFISPGIKLYTAGNFFFMENNSERFPYPLKPSVIVLYFVYL